MSQTYKQVARTVSADKAAHPERYCKYCLWKTATVSPDRKGYILNSNPCPKHEITIKRESICGQCGVPLTEADYEGQRCSQCGAILPTDNPFPLYSKPLKSLSEAQKEHDNG